jgi:hypothetical protein
MKKEVETRFRARTMPAPTHSVLNIHDATIPSADSAIGKWKLLRTMRPLLEHTHSKQDTNAARSS